VELFTIGHGNLDLEVFLAALQYQRIGRVIDVRSIPHSRYAPWAGLRRIESALQMLSNVYEFAGRALGGRPVNPALRTQAGTPDYDRIAQSAAYLEGIEHVLQEAETERIALLCSEANPMLCHRERLIGRTLRSRGCSVRHILPDGTLFPVIQETLA
jgi:uncharacterized protein (DUF488 family)